MTVLKIKKVNEVFVQIECDDAGVHYELSDFFSFFVPGYRWMPAFKNKMWNGKINLYNTRNHTLYAGLVPYVQEFAEARDATVEFEDNAQYGRMDSEVLIDETQLMEFVRGLSLHAHTERIEPRDYQIDAVLKALRTNRALLLSPTASGKSLIIYILIRWFLAHSEGKVLLVVPTTSLVEQMYTDFADYSSHDESWDNANTCHRIYSGKEKIDIRQRVIITTWQSIYKMPASWFEPYRMVIGDEAHNFKAKSLAKIMESLRDAKYRIGTTGTLDGTQTHKLVLEGLFGPVYKVTTTKELMDRDQLSALEISVLLLKYDDDLCQASKKFTYQEELDWLVKHEARNRFIRNLAIAQNGNTLILYNYVEKHGKPLYDAIKAKLEANGSICL